MSNFVTLLVEDDESQREAFADLLKDEGFEVIECTTAEAAELIIASTGTELQALITDHNLAGAMSGAQLAQYARRQHPHMNIIIMSGKTVEPISGQHHVPTKALHRRAVARSGPRLKSVRAPLQRPRAYPRLQSHRQFLTDSGGILAAFFIPLRPAIAALSLGHPSSIPASKSKRGHKQKDACADDWKI